LIRNWGKLPKAIT